MNTYQKKSSARRAGKRVLLLLAMAVALFMCVSCSKTGDLVATGNGYRDNKTKLLYHDAPSCYEPVSYRNEVVARFDGKDLYAVLQNDNSDYLYCPDYGALFYRDGVTLPDLGDMHVDSVHFFLESESSYEFAVESDAEVVKLLADAYREGESLEYPSQAVQRSFRVKFFSSAYPGIFYTVIFLQYEDDYVVEYPDGSGQMVTKNYGRSFLYNRYEGNRFVPVGDLFQEYVDAFFGTDETTGAESESGENTESGEGEQTDA